MIARASEGVETHKIEIEDTPTDGNAPEGLKVPVAKWLADVAVKRALFYLPPPASFDARSNGNFSLEISPCSAKEQTFGFARRTKSA